RSSASEIELTTVLPSGRTTALPSVRTGLPSLIRTDVSRSCMALPGVDQRVIVTRAIQLLCPFLGYLSLLHRRRVRFDAGHDLACRHGEPSHASLTGEHFFHAAG